MEWPPTDQIVQESVFHSHVAKDSGRSYKLQQLVLDQAPTVLLILLSPLYLRHYYRQPIRVLSEHVLWVKMTAAAALLAIELISLAVWRYTPTLRDNASIATAASPFIAAVLIGLFINAEHRRSLRSSALPSIYLLVSVLSDLAKVRNYLCHIDLGLTIGLSLISAFIKIILIFLLEISKRSHLADSELCEFKHDVSIMGFWSRSFFVWVNRTMFVGFRTIITVDDLESLGPEFSSERLSTGLARNMRDANKQSRHSFLKCCISTFDTEFYSPVLPRLCFICFKFSQPAFLHHIVAYIGGEGGSPFAKTTLIATSILIFLGIALSRSIYNHMNSHYATMLRGAIVPLMLKKTLVSPHEVVRESAALTLMSTDIEELASGVHNVHLLWSSLLEVGLAVYMLCDHLDDGIRYILILLAFTVMFSLGLGKWLGSSFASWNKAIEKRVARTARALSQVESLKMVGLEGAVSNQIQKLRVAEVSRFKSFVVVATLIALFAGTAYIAIPIIAIESLVFRQEPASASFTPVKAFTTLGIVALITNPSVTALGAYQKVHSAVACFDRIGAFLFSENPVGRKEVPKSDDLPAETLFQPHEDVPALMFDGAHVAPSPHSAPIFHNLSFSIRRSRITAILGPVGSGKTTLLRSMLGEAPAIFGQILRQAGDIAYCGQQPWLRNASIRKNIVGRRPFDPVWYEVVLNACALNEDLQRLPLRDSYVVGANGANLSGGQKHRVALARALYSRSSILLLDDIFRGLDDATADDIHKRLFGPKGVLRKTVSTVVFATNSATFMKAAHQALILDGEGSLSVQNNAPAIVLSNAYIQKLARCETSTEFPEENVISDRPEKTLDIPNTESDEQLRQRGDFALYRYFFRNISRWQISLAFFAVFSLGFVERFSGVLIRIWLEVDAENDRFYTIYVALGALNMVMGIFCYWIYHLKIVPENSLKLHKSLLDTVMGAPISFINSTEVGSIINRFSQDMTLLTKDMNSAFYDVIYMTGHVVCYSCVIISGLKYAAILVPLLILSIYVIQLFYLRTSRQLRHLNTESKTPLYTLFVEVSSGLEHIRAFGWQSDFVDETLQALELSQKPYYYMFAIQRWLELAIDCSCFGLALVLVSITTVYKESTSESAMGLSMMNLITFSGVLNAAVVAWTRLETALGSVLRLRDFTSTTPAEATGYEVQLPPQWPQSGNIVLSNVTAKYSPADTTAALYNVSLNIDHEQKVGISGRTGSGKTSLLLTMLRLMDYTGTIVIDGIDISTIAPKQLRSRITTVSQDTICLDGSIRDNILPYEGQQEDETIHDGLINEALDKVELTETIEARGGLDIPLSEMALSEGQMQLLALARAILHNTCTQSKVVLMDEPTSSIDVETDNRIQATIRDEFAGCTMVVVSHREETLWDSNVRYEVRNGFVVRVASTQHPPQRW